MIYEESYNTYILSTTKPHPTRANDVMWRGAAWPGGSTTT